VPGGVSEIAVRVELAKSTVSRLLTTLEGIGTVDRVFRAIVPAPHRVEASV
jgi:DNA-binding IclR family transcriptional regulator